MRTATEEEDRILHSISVLENENYNLENECILCNSQKKGYKEERRKLTVKFYTYFILWLAIILISLGYVVFGRNNSAMAIAFFLGSGIAGFLIFGTIFTAVTFVKYVCATSSLDVFKSLAQKINVDNIASAEYQNNLTIIHARKTIDVNKEKIDESYHQYFKLKEENDIQYEKDIASGKIKPIINIDAYNSFMPVDNVYIEFNRARAMLALMEKERSTDSADLDKLVTNKDNNKKSIGLFIILWIISLFIFIGLLMVKIFEKDQYLNYIGGILAFIAFAFSFAILVICIINFVVSLSSIADNKLTQFISDKLGTNNMLHEINALIEKLKKTDEKILETKEKISNLKLEIESEEKKYEK